MLQLSILNFIPSECNAAVEEARSGSFSSSVVLTENLDPLLPISTSLSTITKWSSCGVKSAAPTCQFDDVE